MSIPSFGSLSGRNAMGRREHSFFFIPFVWEFIREWNENE